MHRLHRCRYKILQIYIYIYMYMYPVQFGSTFFVSVLGAGQKVPYFGFFARLDPKPEALGPEHRTLRLNPRKPTSGLTSRIPSVASRAGSNGEHYSCGKTHTSVKHIQM